MSRKSRIENLSREYKADPAVVDSLLRNPQFRQLIISETEKIHKINRQINLIHRLGFDPLSNPCVIEDLNTIRTQAFAIFEQFSGPGSSASELSVASQLISRR